MWAKSVLKQQEEADEEGDGGNGGNSSRSSRALVVKSTLPSTVARRKRSNASASLVAAARKSAARAKVEELLKKEPSQMTMGELALTVPKGRRVNRHEHEVAADTPLGLSASSSAGSSLLNTNALNRLRSFSVSSESAALGGSIMTPQVQIIDGKMVVLESTVSMSDVATHRSDELSDFDDNAPRRSGARYYLQPQVQGRRWGKDETKQFYYVRTRLVGRPLVVLGAGAGLDWTSGQTKTDAGDWMAGWMDALAVLEPGRTELFHDGDALSEPEAQGAQVQVQVRGEAPPSAD